MVIPQEGPQRHGTPAAEEGIEKQEGPGKPVGSGCRALGGKQSRNRPAVLSLGIHRLRPSGKLQGSREFSEAGRNPIRDMKFQKRFNFSNSGMLTDFIESTK
jgi:hypothetical protein